MNLSQEFIKKKIIIILHTLNDIPACVSITIIIIIHIVHVVALRYARCYSVIILHYCDTYRLMVQTLLVGMNFIQLLMIYI